MSSGCTMSVESAPAVTPATASSAVADHRYDGRADMVPMSLQFAGIAHAW